MTKDPLFHDRMPQERLKADPDVTARIATLQWLRLATGVIALLLVAAIWLTWRWG